ncbi:hypothetical protein DIRU0_C30988 [Diutina rugosa]
MSFFEFITSTVMMAKGSSSHPKVPSKDSSVPLDDNFEEIVIGSSIKPQVPKVIPSSSPPRQVIQYPEASHSRHSSVYRKPIQSTPKQPQRTPTQTPRQTPRQIPQLKLDEATQQPPVTPQQPQQHDSPLQLSSSAIPESEELAAGFDFDTNTENASRGVRHSQARAPSIRLNRLSFGGASYALDQSPIAAQSPPSRSSSTRRASLVGSSLTNHDQNNTIPQANRTPSSMTPSARLKLRRLQIADSLKSPQQSSLPVDDDDDVIDSSMPVYNVPLSQPLTSINQGEKFTFGNDSRNSSLASSRSSSLTSNNSDKIESPETTTTSIASTSADTSALDLGHMNKDAQRLTMMFSQNEAQQLCEQNRQRRSMLASCKRLSMMPMSEELLATVKEKSNSPVEASAPAPAPSLAEVKQLSSESSKYFSYTRPTWLPPKSNKDKLRHQKQSEHLIYQALLKESQEQAKTTQRLEKIGRLKVKDTERWRQLSDMTMARYKVEASVDDMVWRGISPEVRPRAWWKEHLAQTSEHQWDQQFCEHYFQIYDTKIMPNLQKFDELSSELHRVSTALEVYRHGSAHHASTIARFEEQERRGTVKLEELKELVVTDNGATIGELKFIFDEIMRELVDVFPDVNFFQGFDVMHKLCRILIAFVVYLHDCQAGSGAPVSDFYFPEITPLVSVFFYQFRNSQKALAQVCQVYSRRLLQMVLGYKVAQRQVKRYTESGQLEREQAAKISLSVMTSSLQNYFLDKFELSLNRNCNRLYTHFKVMGIKPMDYLPELILGLFANKFNFNLTCHVLDIFLFNDDEVMIKLVLGLMQSINHKLFGNRREVVSLLHGQGLARADDARGIYRYFNVGYDHEYVDKARTIKIC